MHLRIVILAFGVAIAEGTQAHAQGSESPGRLVTLPGAKCDSAGSETLRDSTIAPFKSVDIPPRLLSAVMPVVPTSVGHTPARTVLEMVVEATGRLDPCHIRVIEETAPAWTDAVLHSLKKARYSPAQRYGLSVAVRFTQQFTAKR